MTECFFRSAAATFEAQKSFLSPFFQTTHDGCCIFSDAVKMQSAFISGQRWKFGGTFVCNKKSTDIVQMSSDCAGGRVVCIFTSSL